MDEEEQFVNIDLNDDNICSVCKLETENGTLSFCHICFELSIEGVSAPTLLHSKSLRGHRDCFEKCHLIANQKLSRSKVSRGAYEGMKLAFSQKLARIIQYAQNKDSPSPNAPSRRAARLLGYGQQSERRLLPQSDAQVPRYAPRWDPCRGSGLAPATMGTLERHTQDELASLQEMNPEGWPGRRGSPLRRRRGQEGHSRDALTAMSVDELHQLNNNLLLHIQKVFEELSSAVQEKDSLASELHVRHVAIEQLFKNCAKLPWLHISRAGAKASGPPEAGAAPIRTQRVNQHLS